MLLRMCLLVLLALPVLGQDDQPESNLEIDFLAGYYDQDGDHSPVTGGEGTEDLQSISPVINIRYVSSSQTTWTATLGLDNITSASTDNMDVGEAHESSASRMDNRAFTNLGVSRSFGDHTWGGGVSFSKEYDYSSLGGGVNWSTSWGSKNNTLDVALYRYQDEVELYGIDGILRGTDDRETTDVSLGYTRVLARRAVGMVEFSLSDQSGFLSSPFQEVILQSGLRVAERLPGSRSRKAVRLSLNYAFNRRLAQRSYVRFYDDDFGVQAVTVELETHVRVGSGWLYPILRFHSQDASDYFGLPRTFTQASTFLTADRDLSEFDSDKFGLGYRARVNWGVISRVRARITAYSRDDGLDAYNVAFGFGWSR